MLRVIGGVLVGYLATALLVTASFLGAYWMLGADGMLEAGGFEPRTLWSVASLFLGFGGALVGGFVSVAVGKSVKAATILASLFLVVGLLMAATEKGRPAPTAPATRSGNEGFLTMVKNGKEPTWVSFSNPIIGAAGVLLGATLRKRS